MEEHLHTIISGKLFNELIDSKLYVFDLNTRNTNMSVGSNFMDNPDISKGFPFVDMYFIKKYINKLYDNKTFHYAEIPDEAKILIDNHRYITNKINISEIKKISEIDFLEFILKEDYKFISHIEYPTIEQCEFALNNNIMSINFINNLDDEICLMAIRINPIAIIYIKNPSNKVIIEGIKNYPSYLEKIQNMEISEELANEIIAIDPMYLKYIKNQTEQLCINAINLNMDSFQFIKNKTINIIRLVLDKDMSIIFDLEYDKIKNFINDDLEQIYNNPDSILTLNEPTIIQYYIAFKANNELAKEMLSLFGNRLPYKILAYLAETYPNHLITELGDKISDELRWILLKNDDIVFTEIPNLSEEMLLYGIKRKPHLIHLIENPNDEICKYILKFYIKLLPKIKNPPLFIKKKLLKLHPEYVLDLKNPTQKQIYEAVCKKPELFKTIINMNVSIEKKTCNNILKEHPHLIEFIENPSEFMCIIVLNRNPELILKIKNATTDIKFTAICKKPELINKMDVDEDFKFVAIAKKPELIKLIDNPSNELIEFSLKTYPSTNIFNF